MDLRRMRYFVAVAEELSFTRAAVRLHIAQPPLSQQIMQLELELGVPLFTRTKRRVELTGAGRVFLDEARLTLMQAERAVRRARDADEHERSVLRLGFAESTVYGLLPRLVRELRAASPKVDVIALGAYSDRQIEMIESGELHAGLLRTIPASIDLEFREIRRDPFVLALPAMHPLAAKEPVPVELLRDEPFVFLHRHVGPEVVDAMVGLFVTSGFQPRIVQEADELHTLLALVAAGIGITVAFRSFTEVAWPRVVFRQIGDPLSASSVGIAWRRGDDYAPLQSLLAIVEVIASSSSLDL